MAATPSAQRALALAGAVVSAAIGVVFLAMAVVLTVRGAGWGVLPGLGDGSMFWWLVPLFVLIAVSALAVTVSYSRDWRRARIDR